MTTVNTIESALPMDEFGRCMNRPPLFYRVENWNTGRFIADFASQSEAKKFAISDARQKGCRYDHKVSTMRIVKGS